MNTIFRGQAEPSSLWDVSKPYQIHSHSSTQPLTHKPMQWLALSDTNKQIFNMRNIRY